VNGEVLAGRYRLLNLLGRGGAGEVWQAEDQVLARPVAVKLLRRLEGDPMDAVARFRVEAQAAARLLHPNVVATYDVGTAAGQVFLVMELVTGPDLAKLLRSGGLPPAKQVADIAVQGARALDAAHAAGIVHRDVKPGNLLLASDGTLKITDFGIAQASGLSGATGPVLLGTAAYISPEQVRGERATPASDWYALGCVLYELLEGTPPFIATDGADATEVLRQHLETTPPPVRRTDVPAGLADLVMRLLAKDPAARPSSAAEVVRALSEPAGTQVLQFLPAAESPQQEEGSKKAKAGLPFAKAIVALAVVLAGVVIAALLREGVAADPTAQAGGPPSQPAVTNATASPKPTPTPVKSPTSRPSSPKPKATPSATTREAQLRTLAELLRQTGQGRGSKSAKEAAKDLDDAADALADDDPEAAANKFQDAQSRLMEAQRQHRWQATPQIVTLFVSLARSFSGDGQHNNSNG
jgi:serine/threonine protein kinase